MDQYGTAHPRLDASLLQCTLRSSRETQERAREVPAAMRLNVWIVVAILFALFAVTRYPRYHETPRICLDDPTASVCKR
jgi:hypothetical protein